ncbi:MAG: transglycosylase SLT domain-containing protein, partial [Solirubrobacterales bacterium]|nr:transglycosylase SLT domain-containing protein [Solirubrobacterales bacterium]
GTGAERTDAPQAHAREAGPPAPDAPLPQGPDGLAERLQQTHDSLHAAIKRWLDEGDRQARPPREVTLYALYQQRIYMLLASSERRAHRVLSRLRGPVAAQARDTLAARRELGGLTSPVPRRFFETGPARSAGELLGYYREAERRFGVSWQVLAAVNLIESAFGRMRNESIAGAGGPMQFIPSTWEAYGMGGDVRDPHDAIMGAANYLHASGAPENYARALYAYNPSSSYVDAVLSYARAMRRDPYAYFAFHSWQVFVHTPSGVRRLTGPGIRP